MMSWVTMRSCDHSGRVSAGDGDDVASLESCSSDLAKSDFDIHVSIILTELLEVDTDRGA